MTRPLVQLSAPASSPPLHRRVMALAALIAFLLQGLVLQTHVHPAILKLSVPLSAATGHSLPSPLKSPDSGQGNCRLCQEIAHAGAYIAPAVAVLQAASVIATTFHWLKQTRRIRPASGFAWQSRGPPSH